MNRPILYIFKFIALDIIYESALEYYYLITVTVGIHNSNQ